MDQEGIVFRIGAKEGAGCSMRVSLVEACAAKLVSEDEKVARKSIWGSVRFARCVVLSRVNDSQCRKAHGQ